MAWLTKIAAKLAFSVTHDSDPSELQEVIMNMDITIECVQVPEVTPQQIGMTWNFELRYMFDCSDSSLREK